MSKSKYKHDQGTNPPCFIATSLPYLVQKMTQVSGVSAFDAAEKCRKRRLCDGECVMKHLRPLAG